MRKIEHIRRKIEDSGRIYCVRSFPESRTHVTIPPVKETHSLGLILGISVTLVMTPVSTAGAAPLGSGSGGPGSMREVTVGLQRMEPSMTSTPESTPPSAAGNPPVTTSGRSVATTPTTPQSPPAAVATTPTSSPAPASTTVVAPASTPSSASTAPSASSTDTSEPAPKSTRRGYEPLPPGDQGLDWGYERPTPAWKWVGFGASVAVLLGASAASMGSALWVQSSGGFRKELINAAEATVNDSNPSNDVPPSLPSAVNLCEYNEFKVDASGNPSNAMLESGAARSLDVAEVCARGNNARRASTILGVTAASALLSTAVFTTLLFVHRKRDRQNAGAWHRRRMSAGFGWAPSGGPTIRLGGHF